MVGSQLFAVTTWKISSGVDAQSRIVFSVCLIKWCLYLLPLIFILLPVSSYFYSFLYISWVLLSSGLQPLLSLITSWFIIILIIYLPYCLPDTAVACACFVLLCCFVGCFLCTVLTFLSVDHIMFFFYFHISKRSWLCSSESCLNIKQNSNEVKVYLSNSIPTSIVSVVISV